MQSFNNKTTESEPMESNTWAGNLLIVSDNEFSTKETTNSLKKLGFSITTMDSTTWETKQIKETDFPIILIDSSISSDLIKLRNLKIIKNFNLISHDELVMLFKKYIPFCENTLDEKMLIRNFYIEEELQDEMNTFLIELISQFFDTIESDLINIRTLINKNDYLVLNKKFHTYKSTFATFGLINAQDEFAYWQKKNTFSPDDYVTFFWHFEISKLKLKQWVMVNRRHQ